MQEFIARELKESGDVKHKSAELLSETIAEVARAIIKTYKKGGKLLICGNGGSAADAQHIAGELVSKFKKERRALPALALTTNTSILTAIGNDYTYDDVFARQVEAWGKRGDVLLAISTSGTSVNIIKAVKKAKKLRMLTVGLTGGNGGTLKNNVDVALVVPSDDIQRIQETHITIGHIVCDVIEQALFKK